MLDVKPWDDETDLGEMEKRVRTIELDGLLWGASKLVPVGYGIKKLQICCVVEDDKVGVAILAYKLLSNGIYITGSVCEIYTLNMFLLFIFVC